MSSFPEEDKLEGWTDYQKFQLLEGLQKVGPDVKKLKNIIIYKTEDEIRAALKFYTKKILNTQSPEAEQDSEVKVYSEPLAEWTTLMVGSKVFEEFPVQAATALRLIAEFAERPPAHLTENVDFKKIYHTIADALEGKPIQPDRDTEIVLNKCMEEALALSNNKSIKIANQSMCNPDEAGGGGPSTSNDAADAPKLADSPMNISDED